MTNNPDALLTRDAAAEALTAAGYPVKAKTLATKACRGGGPPYKLLGRIPLYRWSDCLDWAEKQLNAPRSCHGGHHQHEAAAAA